MTILQFPKKHQEYPFFDDIINDGYHIFSRVNAKKNNYYPNKFPDYPGARLKNLKPGDMITVRIFFRIGSGQNIRADGGYLDLRIEFINPDNVIAKILTQLPEEFPLEKGESIEIFEEEILYRNKGKKQKERK